MSDSVSPPSYVLYQKPTQGRNKDARFGVKRDGHCQSEIKISDRTYPVDLCQSCNLRFIGCGLKNETEKRKAIERKLCGVCYARRDRRAESWWKNENDKTIWMDEVADEHGQVALVARRFDLSNRLDG